MTILKSFSIFVQPPLSLYQANLRTPLLGRGVAQNNRARDCLLDPRRMNEIRTRYLQILILSHTPITRQTGMDLISHPSTDKLKDCRSPDDVLQILSERESAFKEYRDKNCNMIDRLRPVVQIVHEFKWSTG